MPMGCLDEVVRLVDKFQEDPRRVGGRHAFCQGPPHAFEFAEAFFVGCRARADPGRAAPVRIDEHGQPGIEAQARGVFVFCGFGGAEFSRRVVPQPRGLEGQPHVGEAGPGQRVQISAGDETAACDFSPGVREPHPVREVDAARQACEPFGIHPGGHNRVLCRCSPGGNAVAVTPRSKSTSRRVSMGHAMGAMRDGERGGCRAALLPLPLNGPVATPTRRRGRGKGSGFGVDPGTLTQPIHRHA